MARFSGDVPRALELVGEAAELGRRLDDPDLSAMATHMLGVLLVIEGDVARGVALLDEAMTSVVAGQLSPYFTGIVYCNVIGTCLEIADVRRADQWSEAARAWCETLPPESPFPGMCRVNRAEVARLRGAWPEAEAEATRASEELMEFDPMGAAQAFYETGEIRRRIGNLAGAEECFARAREIGFDPQPGLSLLRATNGSPDAALAGLRLAATTITESRLRRARVLGALVDVALSIGDLDAASDAADLLTALAGGLRCPRSWRRRPRRRLARCCSPEEMHRPPSIACATPARHGGTCGSPTRAHARASSTGSRSAQRATRTTPSSSCGRRWQRSIAWARPPTATRLPASCRERRRSHAGSRLERRRSSGSSPPGSRTATSPPTS